MVRLPQKIVELKEWCPHFFGNPRPFLTGEWEEREFPLTPMGVLTPLSAQAWHSAWPPIDMSMQVRKVTSKHLPNEFPQKSDAKFWTPGQLLKITPFVRQNKNSAGGRGGSTNFLLTGILLFMWVRRLCNPFLEKTKYARERDNCQNPNSTNNSNELNLRLDYILTERSTPPHHHPPQTLWCCC
jgi:hypothetical protein